MVTPFDSGGSSAELRQAFTMPSVGDLRNRLVALADESINGHPDVLNLLSYRLPKDKHNGELVSELASMIDGTNPLVEPITAILKHLICTQLEHFHKSMPKEFDLRGASIGNLVLAGGYLHSKRELDKVTFLFTKLVNARGIVRATVNENLHLVADLEDGSQVFGQHRMTGKEVSALTSPICDINLSETTESLVKANPKICKHNKRLIERSELICYPPGSFYSSLIANLLPEGVGKAISNNYVPKVFVPCLGNDPEQIGMTINDSITTLLKYLKKDAGEDCPENRLLNCVLVDSKNGKYPSPVSEEMLDDLGIRLFDTELVTEKSAPYYDPDLLAGALLSLT